MAAIDVPDNNQSDATSIGRRYGPGLPTIVRVGTPCLDNHNPSGSQHHYESGHHRITPRVPPICLYQYRSRFMCIHTFVHGQHLTLPLHVHPAVIFILLIKAAPKLHGCINHRLSITYDWFYMGLRCHNWPCTGMHFNEPGYPFRNLNNSELQNHAKASLRQLTLIPLDRSPHQGTW